MSLFSNPQYDLCWRFTGSLENNPWSIILYLLLLLCALPKHWFGYLRLNDLSEPTLGESSCGWRHKHSQFLVGAFSNSSLLSTYWVQGYYSSSIAIFGHCFNNTATTTQSLLASRRIRNLNAVYLVSNAFNIHLDDDQKPGPRNGLTTGTEKPLRNRIEKHR